MFTTELQKEGKTITIEYEEDRELVDYLLDGWSAENISLEDKLKAREVFKRSKEVKSEEYDIDVYAPSPYHEKGTGFGNVYHATQKYLLKNHRIFLNPEYKGQKVGWYYIQPHILDKFPQTQFRILYTMFESSKPPVAWRSPLKDVEMPMVPSTWVKALFDDYYNIDCKVWGHGADIAKIPYTARDRRGFVKGQKFVILHYNAQYRKGFDILLKAFHLAFPGNKDVRLVLKGKGVEDFKMADPRIKIYSGLFSQSKMNELLDIADLFVFPSRGEGYGLPVVEAMASGLPVIMPKQHGLYDLFIESSCVDVHTKPTPASYPEWSEDMGYFTEASVTDLAEKLRFMYGKWLAYHEPFTVYSVGKTLQTVRKELSAEVKAKELCGIIEDIIEENGF